MKSAIKGRIKDVVPASWIMRAKDTTYAAVDAVHWMLGRRNALIPPTRLMFDGPRGVKAFVENGQEFLRHYIELGGLQRDERILDVGCGIGRKAVPLIGYLGETGAYDGFDINPKGIDWCRRNIEAQHANFRFRHVDVRNGLYNPRGKETASQFAFPYPNGSFDLVVSTSVFTHLLPAEARHYVTEISRVLRPEGRCLLTFFLWNEETAALDAAGRSALPFRHTLEGFRTTNAHTPEDAVCFDESVIRSLLSANGLTVREPIAWGSWRGRTSAASYQDLVLAFK